MKQVVTNDGVANAPAMNTLVAGALIASLLMVEGAMLSLHGQWSTVAPLAMVLLASTVSSIIGFAFSALCGALLFHVIDNPVYAVQVMIVCSIAIQIYCVANLWHSIDWRSLPVFLIGGLPGVPLGAWLLTHLQTGAYRGVLDGLLVAYGAWLLLKRPTRPLRGGPLADLCAGFLGGLTGGLAGFPGASVTIWCALKGWDKAHQRGVYQPFILCMQPMSLLAIQLMQPSSPTMARLDWQTFAFIPAALAGAWLGLGIFKRLSDRQFEFAVNLLLVLSGISLAF
ncbi:hypothetical protein SAMN02990966_07537 [Rhodospirillales bacterium URHD0017]|nr:hypothetical protein SAMN02990966_07537 [Rhodospirillales bacterium URHD0017]